MRQKELHAHINGSISSQAMEKLLTRKKEKDSQFTMPKIPTNFKKGDRRQLEDCFSMFKLIHQLVDDPEVVYMITHDVIHDFANDGVKYVELRTTPRDVPETGMTRRSYLEAVLQAIKDCKDTLDCIVRLIVSIDRRHGVDVAMETIKLAVDYREKSNGLIVGVDLSGDPNVGDARELVPVFQEAQKHGLKIALHLAEVPGKNEETRALLDIKPDRVGHGTFLRPEDGGSQEIVDKMMEHKIPLELCLTSNIIGQTVASFDIHHFKFWYDCGHPCIICTDDKGVFSTSLSEEYLITAITFDLSREDLWNLTTKSIDYIFETEDVKCHLREVFGAIKKSLIS